MTTMDVILPAAILWVGGGLLFVQGSLTNPDASPSVAAISRDLLDELLRLRPAALVALAFFVAVWPAIWIAAHIALIRRR